MRPVDANKLPQRVMDIPLRAVSATVDPDNNPFVLPETVPSTPPIVFSSFATFSSSSSFFFFLVFDLLLRASIAATRATGHVVSY